MIFINKVILIGRLTKETEMKVTPNGTEVLQNSIAVTRNYKNKEGNYDVDFINFVAYRVHAKLIADYFHKGDGIALTGSWTTRSYQNQNGQTINVNELTVDGVEFLPTRKQEPKPQQQEDPFANLQLGIDIDDDLPF